jgi:hypothetical protein
MINSVQTKVRQHILIFKIARRIDTIFLKEGAHDVKWGTLICFPHAARFKCTQPPLLEYNIV